MDDNPETQPDDPEEREDRPERDWGALGRRIADLHKNVLAELAD